MWKLQGEVWELLEKCEVVSEVWNMYMWYEDCEESVSAIWKYGSSKGGVTSIRKVWQLMERCDGHGGYKGFGTVW